jgi:hypothetical protein
MACNDKPFEAISKLRHAVHHVAFELEVQVAVSRDSDSTWLVTPRRPVPTHIWRITCSTPPHRVGIVGLVEMKDAHKAFNGISERYTAAVWRAVAFQVSWAARARPAAMQRARSAGSRTSASMASPSAPVSSGSTSSAAPCATSGSEVAFEVTTGTPDAKASTTGMPKPSYSEGTRTRRRRHTRGAAGLPSVSGSARPRRPSCRP